MKLLFTDLDGTLLNDKSRISDYTKQFLDAWITSGNKLILSSGRPLDSILELKVHAALNYPGMVIISNNGSLIYDCDTASAILEHTLPLDYVNHMMQTAKKMHIHIHTYTDNAIVSFEKDKEVSYYMERIHLPLLTSDNPVSLLEKEPYKALAIDLEQKENLIALQEALSPWSNGKIQSFFSNDRYLEFITANSGKGQAVIDVCNYFHVDIKDSIAAGDMENDISMIQAAGTGIAMNNATKNVKEAANVVTEFTNDEDGLARELEKMFL